MSWSESSGLNFSESSGQESLGGAQPCHTLMHLELMHHAPCRTLMHLELMYHAPCRTLMHLELRYHAILLMEACKPEAHMQIGSLLKPSTG